MAWLVAEGQRRTAPLPLRSAPRVSAAARTMADGSALPLSRPAWDFAAIPVAPPQPEVRAVTQRYQLAATIRMPAAERDAVEPKRRETPVAPTPAAPTTDEREPPTGAQVSAEGERAELPGTQELAKGESAPLPVFVSSYPAEENADAISANLGYSPSVTVSGEEPKDNSDFGSTWGNHIRTAEGGRIHRAKGTFEVTQTYENPIVIRLFKDAGPHGQTNIESETDPDIKAGNFAKVASDLTPGTDKRPPRTQFWARDLTLAHEQFHAADGQKFCQGAVTTEQAALNKQTASSMDEVKALLRPIPDRIIAARAAGMVGGEDRAYAAGAASYKDRADKIKALGQAGKYKA